MASPAIASLSPVRIHATALVEPDVQVGLGTSVWDNVHIRSGARIGEECIVGEKSYIAGDVRIGNRVKINALVYVCSAVSIEDGVMVSAGVIFTNDRYPRATAPDLATLRTSEPDEHTQPTLVRQGATIGARAVVGSALTIGQFAMIGMGSVVTRSIPDFALAMGNPARICGYVCRCGPPILRFHEGAAPVSGKWQCASCGRSYELGAGGMTEISAAERIQLK